jgi:hypothetical protein
VINQIFARRLEKKKKKKRGGSLATLVNVSVGIYYYVAWVEQKPFHGTLLKKKLTVSGDQKLL